MTPQSASAVTTKQAGSSGGQTTQAIVSRPIGPVLRGATYKEIAQSWQNILFTLNM